MMKLDCWLTLTLMLAVGRVPSTVAAETQPAPDAQFQALQHSDAKGATLQYRLLKPPRYDAKKKHPLLLFLHGAGERGSDNKAQLKWGREMMVTAAEDYGCFVLIPQCPQGQKWVEVDWGKPAHVMPPEPSEPMRLAMEVIAGLQKQFSIDRHRLYVMGLSMGGYGTWDAVQRYPDTFAAAVPICGGGDETNAHRITVPVWAFHGDEDRAVPVARSRNMIKALRSAGRKPKYTEYPGVGHSSWSPAFKDPELLKWLFSQRRRS